MWKLMLLQDCKQAFVYLQANAINSEDLQVEGPADMLCIGPVLTEVFMFLDGAF